MSQDFENIPFEGNERNDKRTKARTYLYGAIAIMFILLLLSWFFTNRRYTHKLLDDLKLKEQEFSKYKTENNELVATQEQRILEATKENYRLIQTINKFKEIQGQVKVQTLTKYTEVKVPYKVEVIKYIDTTKPNSPQTYINVPLPFEQNDKFFDISGRVEVDGVFIDSMTIPNELTITTGKTKGGLFKQDKYIIEVVSNNPNVDITKLNNTQFKPKRPLLKKWGTAFGIGILTSLLLL